jgi:hypothetical protein
MRVLVVKERCICGLFPGFHAGLPTCVLRCLGLPPFDYLLVKHVLFLNLYF